MFVSGLRLINFRSFCDSATSFGPGLNVVVGANATGKTNLLEGAWYALRGTSPRTRREEKLVLWGAPFLRVELALEGSSHLPVEVEVGYAPREGKRIRWRGVEVASLDELRSRSQVFIFVPESLLLVKGSPARRRAHLDAFAAALDRQYAAALHDLQEALRQRNAQLVAVKAGGSERALDPWDAQFAGAATELGRRRRQLVTGLSEHFAAAAASLAPSNEVYSVELVTQLAALDFDTAALLDELRCRRRGEVNRGLSMFGPHRDDLRFIELTKSRESNTAATAGDPSASGATCVSVAPPSGGRDLRLFGSQGEQRLAVLALLIAEQEVAMLRTGEPGLLFLDDVMSELDDVRRRLLVDRLSKAGQVIVTTTNRHYFMEEELSRATVIELPLEGSVLGAQDTSSAVSAVHRREPS